MARRAEFLSLGPRRTHTEAVRELNILISLEYVIRNPCHVLEFRLGQHRELCFECEGVLHGRD